MSERMTKAHFLDELRPERVRWEALLAQVDAVRLEQPGVTGDWSVKDIIAHVVWSEREILGVLRQRALVGSDLWHLDRDERNAIVFEQNRHRPAPEVLAEARTIYEQLLAEIEALDDADFVEPGRFRNMPADWLPWQIFAGSTYEHYQAHRPAIEAWLAGTSQAAADPRPIAEGQGCR